jgi:Histidine kinase
MSLLDTPAHLTQLPWWRDWRQWVVPGPRRIFTPEEMAVAGQQPWPQAIDSYLYVNVIILLSVTVVHLPLRWAALALAAGLGAAWTVLKVAHWLWRHPSRTSLAKVGYGFGATGTLVGLATSLARLERDQALAILYGFLALYIFALTTWLLLVLFRVSQIEARLRELSDSQAQLALTRRLATAQIHPHFLFNTLASLTHWVQTADPRAAPLLKDLNAYLRATLPMFERESQPLVQEWALVRNYLGIMQARLGERLQWEITHDPALDSVLVPPGSMLTLAENAITHGVEPALRGAAVRLISQLQSDGRVLLRVEDEGAGLPQPFKPSLGLTNTRDRFRQLYGERAVLTLTPLHPDGSGCRSDVLIDTPL